MDDIDNVPAKNFHEIPVEILNQYVKENYLAIVFFSCLVVMSEM